VTSGNKTLLPFRAPLQWHCEYKIEEIERGTDRGLACEERDINTKSLTDSRGEIYQMPMMID